MSYRFGWLILPSWISWVGAGLFLISYLLYAEVLRENTYLSRTAEVQHGQQVIGTGLYGIVRHPMYSATIILFLSMPLVLGSLLTSSSSLPMSMASMWISTTTKTTTLTTMMKS